MLEVWGPIAAAVALLLVVVGIYVLAWRSLGSLPGFPKWGLRLLLTAVVLLLPLSALIMIGSVVPDMEKSSAPIERVEPRLEPGAESGQQADKETVRERPAKKKAARPPMETGPTAPEVQESRAREAAEEPTVAEEATRRAALEQAQRQQQEARARAERQMAEAKRNLNESSGQAAQAQKQASEAPGDAGVAGPRYYKLERPEPSGGSGPAEPRASYPGPATSAPEPPSDVTAGRPEVAPGDSFRDLGGLGTGVGGSGGGGGTTRGISPSMKPPASANGHGPQPLPVPPPPAASTAPPKPIAAPAPAPVPAGTAGEEKEDWTVVPVYYGTDRARVPNDKRLDYGSDRARKLELGRALITVPKKHEVPQVERPWAIKIPYFNVKIYEQAEDPKSHFTLQELKALSEAELLDLVKQRLAASARFKDHAFVFIHGYNTTFDNALYRTAQVAYDIKFDGAPFLYSWPSGGGIASYTYDGVSAEQAEPFLADFLKLVTQKSGAKSVSLIAHSMGNRLLLRVLQEIHRTKPEGVKISQVILAAPDVDRDSFENIASALQGLPSGGITLYASSNDRALEVSRRFHGGVPRAGDVPNGLPLVVPGVDTIDATSVSMDSLGLHHSGYAESNTLLSDIGALIQTGERPPEKRVPILKKLDSPKGPFWRYP